MFAALAATIFRPPPAPGPFARDFEAYYAAGATWNAGGDPWSRAVWETERRIPGVDATRDELLPFVGPAVSLPLWSLFARLPFGVASALWSGLLLLAFAALALGAAALAHVRITLSRGLSALLFGAVTGPVIAAVALGQVALLSASAVVLTLVALERRSAWAIVTACIAALQPNLALPLAVRLNERRPAQLLLASAAAFIALTLLLGGGPAGFLAYLQRLAAHAAGERFIVIQYSVPAILTSFHVAPNLATLTGEAVAALALAAVTVTAFQLREQPRIAAAIAICALPWIVPFFHEHDFVIELLPAIALTAAAGARVRTLAGIAVPCILVDWLGVAQRPGAAAYTVCLAFAVACAAAALPNRALRAPAAQPLLITTALLALALVPLALAFPAPAWPDALGAFHAAPDLDASAVWAAEQQHAGLGAAVPVWGLLRAIPLLGCALLAVTAYLDRASPSSRAG